VRRQLRSPNGATILLTPGEYSLLNAFLDHPQRILTRDQLLEIARGTQVDVFDRAVDVQISRLRRKLNSCCEIEIIRTVRGLGYLFDSAVLRP
jgi:two-component system OmpR family response regulator